MLFVCVNVLEGVGVGDLCLLVAIYCCSYNNWKGYDNLAVEVAEQQAEILGPESYLLIKDLVKWADTVLNCRIKHFGEISNLWTPQLKPANM